ncbi:hypothetical protein HCU40_15440 [Pseudanabaena biceps]|nr:hypothetical protein [Pseudanabaena biceps]
MTQQSVMELAKSGDPHAIATLINRSLASKGIHATAEIVAECLTISLHAAQIPNQKAVVTIIHRGMMILQIDRLSRVKILTYRSDNNYLAWQHEFKLGDYQKSAQSSSDIDQPSDSSQEQNVNLVRNPRGVILVQKFSQIQQNSQEYQDIIVRFTDEQVGTVRCLTTLTELIQVISKPSFLFAAVAANPNLRSLLDTIAESSHTDENGDQVITNLSILQPGQQWQRAKIRLVTKIFLEPVQLETDPEDKHQVLTLDVAETETKRLETLPEIKPEILSETSNPVAPIPEASAPLPEVKPEILPEVKPQIITESNIEANEPNNTIVPSQSNFAGIDFNSELAVDPLNSITAESLFDDFSESTPSTQVIPDTDINNEALFDNFSDFGTPSPEMSNIEVSQNKESTPSTQVIPDTDINNEALFDNFSDFGTPSPEMSNIEVSQNKESDDSLFSGFFIEEPIKSNAISTEDLSTSDFTINRTITPQNNNNDDLFNSFGDMPSSTVTQDDVESLKARIPKQDLERLLTLMNQAEQSQDITQVANEQNAQIPVDMGATTIERILGNMETLTIGKKDNNTSSNMLTLEDFSEDLESVGF